MQSPELSIHLADLDARVEVMYHLEFSGEGIAELTRQLRPALTVIPDGDGIALEVGRTARWSGHGELSLLIMREAAQPTSVPGLANLKTVLKLIVLQRARAVSGVRITLLKGALWRGKSGFPVARDPVTIEASAHHIQTIRSSWGLHEEVFWFGVLGAVSARKNLPLVAEALTKFGNPGIGLLIAGSCDSSAMSEAQEALNALRRTGARVTLVDRLLEDWELDSAVAAVDAVVLAHSNESPSGLFGKAAAAGTRIVAGGSKSLKRDSSVIGSLAIWSPLGLNQLAEALQWTVNQPSGERQYGLGADSFVGALL
ncbi:hypothetical protein E3T26_02075 [Cryobacterium sp. TMT1-21]|uniref:hypothetical protein n=1 Tax=Cryobacterium sp. TMT1-21 TaxID=1259234 RepID=UPI001069A864|nr:hypothetical protein [Cryobacterium sp. TMT1-21]TFD17436.1 hypothetical protein E3T26_02075 [Cryobacterium sp. TMT1-21]